MADVDRISELPESLLHHVLSFLSPKQAIQTSALSKTWRHVGPTRPKLELRESFFKKSSRATFLSVLDKTLQTYYDRNPSVQEFIFELSSSTYPGLIDFKSRSVLDKHIPTLLTNMCLKKLDLSAPQYILAASLVFRAEFLVELSLSECILINTNDQPPLFKGLKNLSLNKVLIEDQTLGSIIRTSPLIEYLSLSACVTKTIVPINIIFPAEFLVELSLSECILINTNDQPPLFKSLKRLSLNKVLIEDQTLGSIIRTSPLIEYLSLSACVTKTIVPINIIFPAEFKRLRTLSLDKVNIFDETLDKFMSSCPLIEHVLLSDCPGLTNIQLNNNNNNNNNLNHFTASFNGLEKTPTVEIHDEYTFPRLKSLCLNRVTLSPDFFELFSSNFPSLEDLELRRCKGFDEKIQLTSCSIKRLVLIIGSTQRAEANIYAPSINYFEVHALVPPQLFFYTETETAREWNSRVVMLSNDQYSMLTWLIQLSELLSSLSESRISLDVFPNPFKNLRAEDSSHLPGFRKPFIVERMRINGDVRGGNWFSSFTDFFNCLFLICRPRYLGMSWYVTNRDGPDGDEPKMEKNKLAEYIILKVVGGNQGAMSRGNFWERDLDEISMEVWDDKSRRWHSVRVEGTTFPGSTSTDTRIRFQVKWRD